MRASVTRGGVALALLASAATSVVAETLSTRSIRFFGAQSTTDDSIRVAIDAPAQAADVGAADFTIEQWIRCGDQPLVGGDFRASDSEISSFDWIQGSIFLDRDIFGSPPGGGGDWGASIHRAGDATGPSAVRFGAENASGRQLTIQGSVDVCDDAWHHVALGRDTGNRLFLVVDGVLDYRSTRSIGGSLRYPNGTGGATDRQLVWGTEKHGLQGGYVGHLDEVRVWSDERTVAEIASSRGVALSGTEPNLELYLRLEEGDRASNPETLMDATGKTTAAIVLHDGTTGNGEWSSDVPVGFGTTTTTATTTTTTLPLAVAIRGRKLVITNPTGGPTRNRLAYRARDRAIVAPRSLGQDPRCPPDGSGSPAAGGTLRLTGTGGDVTIDLPCAGWSANRVGSRYRYRDPSGSSCTKVVVRHGKVVKVVCHGAQVSYALGVAQRDVRIVLTTGATGSERLLCASFGPTTGARVRRDGSNGRIYKATRAGPPATCLP